MDKKTYNEFKRIIKEIEKITKIEILEITRIINNIINNTIIDERIISHTFDRMLSLEFIEEKEINELYYKLLNYIITINEELYRDYKILYEEKYPKSKTKKLY